MELSELFTKQSHITEDILGIPVKDDPMQFYYSINGIVQEAMESLQEDTRWKEEVFRKPGYKNRIDRVRKVEELTDVLIYFLNACLYSEVSAEEIEEVFNTSFDKRVERFKREYDK